MSPDYCDLNYPNELYMMYHGYELWQCTDTSFDPSKGIVHQPIYYEVTHPDTSWSYDVELVKDWIDANLPTINGTDGEAGINPFVILAGIMLVVWILFGVFYYD